jgi:hypothetical protein
MKSNHVKIKFPLVRNGDDYPPYDVESIWAVPAESGLYKLDNIPFFVRGLSAEDVVSAVETDGELYYDRLVSGGGHGTVRVLVENRQETQLIRDKLRALGCSSELTNVPGLVAVDVPPSVDYRAIRTFLTEGEDQGRWEFEEGCIAQVVE